MPEQRHITAKISDAREEILKCAMYSYCGRIIYRKWDRKQKRYVKRSHVVVPIDCGVTSKGNQVLFAEDVEQHMQVKQFIIKQILSFENLKEKRKTAFPIKLDRIKRMFGIYKVTEDYDMAAGVKEERNLVARELRRVAQEIYEFSGAEGNLYSDRKKADPSSYDVVGDDGRNLGESIARRISRIRKDEVIASRIVIALRDSQKDVVRRFEQKRKDGLSFGDYFNWDSKGRCYFPIEVDNAPQDISEINDGATKRINELLEAEGYVCPDYALGYCYKKSDKDRAVSNPPKVLTIVKKALRNNKNLKEGEEADKLYKVLSKSFNEREFGTLKHMKKKMLVCITHNADDIAGMSTDRDWTSCMHLPIETSEVTEKDLDHASFNSLEKNIVKMHYGILGAQKATDEEIIEKLGCEQTKIDVVISDFKRHVLSGGLYYTTALKQVKYGGMCAYLIDEDDKDIRHPLARIAIKRFENSDGGFAFEAENTVYGNAPLAHSCNLSREVGKLLAKSNATTEKGESEYHRNDSDSYSDSEMYIRDKDLRNVQYLCKAEWSRVYEILDKNLTSLDEDEIDKIIQSHRFPPPKGMFDLFMNALADEFSDEFVEKYKGMMDMDKYCHDHGIPLPVSKPYEGGDAPRSEDEMNDRLYDMMEETRYSDDYGTMEDMEYSEVPTFSGSVDTGWCVSQGEYESMPYGLRAFCMNSLSDALRSYYQDNPEECVDYPTLADFEEAYEQNGIEDDDFREAVRESVEEKMLDDQISWHIVVKTKTVEDGERHNNSVFTLEGTLTYDYDMTESFVGYKRETVINTEDAEWKTKLRDFCEEMYDQLPSVYH